MASCLVLAQERGAARLRNGAAALRRGDEVIAARELRAAVQAGISGGELAAVLREAAPSGKIQLLPLVAKTRDPAPCFLGLAQALVNQNEQVRRAALRAIGQMEWEARVSRVVPASVQPSQLSDWTQHCSSRTQIATNREQSGRPA